MTNKDLIFRLLNGNPKNKRTVTKSDLVGTYGTVIKKVNGSRYTRQSELCKNWSFTVRCLNCKNPTKVYRENVNTLIPCTCGKTLVPCVMETLL